MRNLFDLRNLYKEKIEIFSNLNYSMLIIVQLSYGLKAYH